MPVDFRFLQLLIEAAQDPKVHLGTLCSRSPGARLSPLPTLYLLKRKWHPAGTNRLSGFILNFSRTASRCGGGTIPWQLPWPGKSQQYSKTRRTEGKVRALREQEARLRFPNLTIASLGANRRDMPGGIVSARVLFDGTQRLHCQYEDPASETRSVRPLRQTYRGRCGGRHPADLEP